jgi:hypothetical protein
MVIKGKKHRQAAFSLELHGRSMLVMRLEAKQPPAGRVLKRLSGFQENAAKHRESRRG